MNGLLTFLVQGITGNKDFTIEESEEEGQVNLRVILPTSDIGLVIGKGGQTIKAIQTLVRVRGRLEDKIVQVFVEEKTN
ncbi:hypothetical protein A2714_01810 [Candidatus Woesebacteria bacterium RIFCSPHIGHO2_01_FULL_38_9]|uniref:Uncharacterized protein n=2 Tax=Candidatus Woeseibacteriota TaxID=1752722 RepID=A0A1F7Y2B4_9BACT|nr:MAG: hypothetical protein A2714_01810 [Candidatus Woesebacteria bacterium RIFCSPHIGHO2_01_FULL_38_9]OGM58566.1 MAG: hypothetical protein A3A75_02500 [Candidatus Woesebacteria bacterium RIFCSPLOWO2_01_FULL_39_10]